MKLLLPIEPLGAAAALLLGTTFLPRTDTVPDTPVCAPPLVRYAPVPPDHGPWWSDAHRTESAASFHDHGHATGHDDASAVIRWDDGRPGGSTPEADAQMPCCQRVLAHPCASLCVGGHRAQEAEQLRGGLRLDPTLRRAAASVSARPAGEARPDAWRYGIRARPAPGAPPSALRAWLMEQALAMAAMDPGILVPAPEDGALPAEEAFRLEGLYPPAPSAPDTALLLHKLCELEQLLPVAAGHAGDTTTIFTPSSQ